MIAAHDTQALAACPCCGAAACELSDTSDHIAASIGVWDHVICNASKGGCGMRSGYYDSAEEAVAAWNRRPALASRLQEQEGQPALSEREKFEAWYCADATRKGFECKSIAELREGDSYGEKRVALNSKWYGWQGRATLAAGSQAVQVPGWRPIDSAPKDGTRVILSWGGKSINGFYLDNSATAAPWQGWRVESMVLRPDGLPMAWMPFPPVLAAPLQPLAGGEVGK